MTIKQRIFMEHTFGATQHAQHKLGVGGYLRSLAVSLLKLKFPDSDAEKVIDDWLAEAQRGKAA